MTVISTPGQVGSRAATSQVDKALKSGRRDWAGSAFMVVVLIALLMSVVILAVLVVDMLVLAQPVITTRFGEFLTGTLSSKPETSGIVQGLKGTFWIGVFTVVISFPLGISAAIYLEEYAHHESRLARFIDLNIRNLAGVPSVVYGILGLTIFVKAMEGITGPDSAGKSVISAGLTLAILVLPIVIIASQEAIRAIPPSLRDAAYAMGATKWQVVKLIVLPQAIPGIMSGVILALSRAIGEAAPILMISGIVFSPPFAWS